MRRRLLSCAVAVFVLGLASNAQTSSRVATSCATTTPNMTPGPGNHGDGKLWTNLPVSGTVGDPSFIQDDGAISIKFMWWRAVRGRLVITGTRIDASAPPLVARVPEGYGPTGFQASGIIFPTRGCWSVTGAVGDEKLIFIVEVTVGRETAPVPRAILLRRDVHRTGVVIDWSGNDAAWNFDLRVRSTGTGWQMVLQRTYNRAFFFRPRVFGRFEVEVRARDRFAPGPWSRPRAFRFVKG